MNINYLICNIYLDNCACEYCKVYSTRKQFNDQRHWIEKNIPNLEWTNTPILPCSDKFLRNCSILNLDCFPMQRDWPLIWLHFDRNSSYLYSKKLYSRTIHQYINVNVHHYLDICWFHISFCFYCLNTIDFSVHYTSAIYDYVERFYLYTVCIQSVRVILQGITNEATVLCMSENRRSDYDTTNITVLVLE